MGSRAGQRYKEKGIGQRAIPLAPSIVESCRRRRRAATDADADAAAAAASTQIWVMLHREMAMTVPPQLTIDLENLAVSAVNTASTVTGSDRYSICANRDWRR